MWSTWIIDTIENILNDLSVKGDLKDNMELNIYEAMGFDKKTRSCRGDGAFACDTMENLIHMTKRVINNMFKVDGSRLDSIFKKRWTTPDPVALAFPRANLKCLFTQLKTEFGLKVCVCTTDDKDPTDLTLKALEVESIVDVRLGGDMGVAPKPSKDQIEYLCDKLGENISPAEVVMVGDTPRDMQMAINSGCALGIGVLGGASGRSDLMKANHVIENLDGVLDVLRMYMPSSSIKKL